MGNNKKKHEIEIIVDSNKNVDIVSIDKNTINPGSFEDITFKIKNVGSTELRNIIFSFENNDNVLIALNGDNKEFIEKLDINEEKEITFKISASSITTPDLYKLNLILTYENIQSSEKIQEISSAGIYIGGKTDFDLTFDEKLGTEYIFTIANIGSNDANSVKVSIDESSYWKTTGKSAEIIGTLNQGDYTTISYDFSEIKGNLILNIEYTDTLGNRISSLKELSIKTNSNLTNSNIKIKNTGSDSTQTKTGISSMGPGITTLVTWAKYIGYSLIIIFVILIGLKLSRKKNKKNKIEK